MVQRAAASAGGWLRAFLAVPLRPQTYLNLLYLSLAFPLGLAYVVFLSVGLSLGVGLAVLLVGIPILAVVVAVALGLAGVERHLAALLLGLDIEPSRRLDGDTTWERVRALLTDSGTWTTLVYLPSKFVLGLASFLVVMTMLTTGVSMLFVPFYYDQPGLYVGLVADRPVELHPALYLGWNNLLVGFETAFSVGSWEVTTLTDALVVAALGAVLCLVGLHVLNGLARLSAWYTDRLLGDTYDVVSATRRSLDI